MSGPLRARRVAGTDAERLIDPMAPGWARCLPEVVSLAPAPVALVAGVSPYVAASSGHGRVPRLEVRAAHDGISLWLRLAWPDTTRDDRLTDLDRFADAAAVMFPLTPAADPFRMGSPEDPVNAWLWRADAAAPFDVFAEGYATSRRRPAAASGLEARAHHDGRGWALVFRRPLAAPGAGFAALSPGAPAQVAFAIWDGSHRDRSAQKAVSARALPLLIDG